MLFSGIPFLYYFLPAVLIIYFAVPKKMKNAVLLLASLVFYAWGEPKYIILMVVSIISGYVFGLLISRTENKTTAKLFLALSIIVSLGMLGYFKYADFFITSFNGIFGTSVGLLNVALPIGISFYTFQIISYVIDVYRGEASAQKNFISLAMYISMFPQLIAGPIVRYTDVEAQLSERSVSFDKAAYGIRRFAIGLGKKVMLANTMGELCDIFTASDDRSVLFYWLYALAFALQIYFDFSGYSDMAIGLGRIFGFSFPENFDHPFASRSISEFWRRWHISLGSWFRDYVYIPLGGSRCSGIRTAFNLAVVWFLTGLWHGAAWNFAVWGLYFALFTALEKHFLMRFLEKSRVISHIYVIIVMLISFVIFNAGDLSEAVSYIGAMFGAGDIPIVSESFIYYFRSYLPVIAVSIAGSLPVFGNIANRIVRTEYGETVAGVLEIIMIAALLIVCTAFLVSGSFNPFLYFRF